MGWMVGSPPPADKIVAFADGSFRTFPQTRWAFSHMRELVPTTAVSRGTGAVAVLPRALRADVDAVSFQPLGRADTMTWAQSLDANYTDGIVVLHRGRIVYERYFGVLTPERQHLVFSVTKSFVGTLAATLIAEGALDAKATVAHYVPELEDSAFGDATIQHLLDMTTGIKFVEDYAAPDADIELFARAGNLRPRPADYRGPQTLYGYLRSVSREVAHGERFAYKTPNTDVLGWVLRRVSGKPVGTLLHERIWQKIGAEQDAYFTVDPGAVEFAGGGLNVSLRDLARFGEMMRRGGRYNGQQIVPASVVDDIRRGGRRDLFATGGLPVAAGVELPRDVVAVAQRARRVQRTRNSRSGHLCGSHGGDGHRASGVPPAGGQRQLRRDVAPGLRRSRETSDDEATLTSCACVTTVALRRCAERNELTRPMPSVLLDFIRAVVDGDIDEVSRRLAASPVLARTASDVGATRHGSSAFFFADIAHYFYAGDTALHMAAAAFRRPVAEILIAHGAECRAKNRRGAEPLHYAADANRSNPTAQAEIIDYLLSVGADRQCPGPLRRGAPAPSRANAVAGGRSSTAGWRRELEAAKQNGIHAAAPRCADDRARRKRFSRSARATGRHCQAVARARRQGDRRGQARQDGASGRDRRTREGLAP